ncbi:Ig-like domain-containing protein [Microbacterium sp. SS28]|uniref:Ig-like domain-containing protein n=1 Tax=Microbacterium sp. SS28 TaxID=2919948 RepID=UPI001FA97867|nr:Ig-like domain-containing protein [Microbacterium sp. SS28]
MRRRSLAGVVAAVACLGLVVTASIVWPGLDAQETPEVDTALWALQTGEGLHYARVNTAVGELDTVRSISNPSEVAQTDDGAYVFSDSYSKLTRIDAAMPVDLDEETLRASPSTPAGTTDVATAGDFVAYRTDSGAVFVGRLSTGQATQIDPFPSDAEDAPQYTADAIAVDPRGLLFSYSRADASVLRYDIPSSEVRGRDPLEADGLSSPVITAGGDEWVVVDADDGDVWLAGADTAERVDATGTVVVGAPDPAGEAVYLATETGLVRVPLDGSAVTEEVGAGATVLGEPARPVVHDGEVFAAWLAQGATEGVLWNSGTGRTTVLDYAGRALGDDLRPRFVTGGTSVILNETRSGWVWTVPDGDLVESSQDWTLDDRTNEDAEPSDEQLTIMIDPKPPVAEPDAFGVRAGSLASLPVLLNDHDPNEDVLSIDPASVTGLDPGFGTTSITDNGQRLAVRVAPDAVGSATFSYAVTDGTSQDGLVSQPTTVTIEVAPESRDTAPVWCGVEGCLLPWPEPQVATGGTVTIPVLPGWVDPEGDPRFLLSVENPSGRGSVASTPSGDVVYQHDDDGSGGEELVELSVTVSDTRGMTTTVPLVVRVSPEPQLQVQSFAVVDSMDAGLTVDVAPHVTGTAGALALESVRVLDGAPATATVVGGTTSFDFSAQVPGTIRVGFTVTDGISDADGTARITILPADAPPELATAPVVAFVHPKQDATLDVFDAVSNPTRRVLLLSDVVVHPDAGASLSVDTVGQSHLRVSGSTETGAVGRLGTVTYTVSDGTEDRGASVQGEATVYLLPLAPELAPIAVDDTVVVRAGSQIDIPVLDNDIAPSGGRPTLDPSSVVSSTDAALAFASGGVLRYLAPSEPGEYGIRYSVFTTGAPALADTADVRIQVLSDDANRAPLPETLEGRVLSGQSVLVEFDGFGMDPDGDVVTLDRIMTQPETGAATISADGASILYSSVAGRPGQVSFRYRVVDAFGATGEGTVRIGVLDGASNPSPITYTDYVQVQAGHDSRIRVSPLSNDLDPTMGRLSLQSVRPDLPEFLGDGSPNPEFARLDDLIVTTNDTTVVIGAGTQPATMSFLYDVVSSSGNTGRGLIVVKVVRESVPDYPVVADTVLTIENRDDFEDGVDVLDGKAAWSAGDVEDLAVSLWGDPDGVSVDGSELSGDLPARSRVIPFAVSGAGPSGPVTTYAFLRVPGDDDLSLILRSGAQTPQATELASVTFDMATLVARPPGRRIEVGDEVRASGARADASCVLESGTSVRYDAGAGAPWADACQVPVRLDGQKDWTYLSVPITVVPVDPQPVLHPASLTVGPGETATFDLTLMTTWQLREDWDGIEYALTHTGSAFQVVQDDNIVTVTGADRAVPGAEEVALVDVASHPDVPSARLILRVGAAPSTLPQGASVTQQCSQAAGTSCAITVVGGPGEVNPLPRTPLEIVDVRATGACAGVAFERGSATTIVASWTEDAAGATCTASFSVQDAQGRRTNADRDGRLLLDLQGFPRAPAGLSQTAYDDGTLTLRVDPGDARAAYPALTGFVVRRDDVEVARCAPDGTCPVISAPNGEQRTYDAVAVNAVGESRTGVQTVGWAYRAPRPPQSVTASPVVTPSGEGGVISLSIAGLEPDQTGAVEITAAGGETARIDVRPGQDRVDLASYRLGSNSSSPVTVTPLSRFELPPGLSGSQSGAAVTIGANGIGAPRDPVLTLSAESAGDGTSTVTARGAAALNGDGSALRYGIVRDGDVCTPTPDGAVAVFSGLPDGEEYRFELCVESWYDGSSFGRSTTTQSVRAVQSGKAPKGWTFAVDGQPDVRDGRAEWIVRAQPTSTERVPNRNHVEFSGWPTGVFDRDPAIQVRYVHDVWGTATPWATVVPAAGSAPYQLQASWWVQSCAGGATLDVRGDSSNTAQGKAVVGFSNAQLVYYDRDDAILPHIPDTWDVPRGAVRVEGIGVTASWSAQGWGLSDATRTMSATCEPNDPPGQNPAP